MSGSPKVLFRLRELKVSSKMGWGLVSGASLKTGITPRPSESAQEKPGILFFKGLHSESAHCFFIGQLHSASRVCLGLSVPLSLFHIIPGHGMKRIETAND